MMGYGWGGVEMNKIILCVVLILIPLTACA
jgi:hypothetical protein